MSGPVGAVVMGALRSMGPDNEFSVFFSDAQKRRIIHSIVNGYYDEYPEAEIVIDTNRLWCSQLPLIRELYPSSKMIACVRSPAWVMDSLERLHRKNPLHVSKLFGGAGDRATVFNRAESVLRGDRLIGFALNALKEAYYSPEAKQLLLVEYDILCQRPKQVMDLIYGFLEEPAFEHDFDNVEYEAEMFDRQLDTPGLHSVKSKVKFAPRETCLPPDVFKRFAQMAFWRDDANTRAFRIVEQTGTDKDNRK